MNKIQKFTENKLIFNIFIFILIITLLCLLSPKVSSQLFSYKRNTILSEFINATKTNNKIDPRAFWKLREFYSPGIYTFSREGIEKSLIQEENKKINVDYNKKNITLTFLNFSAPLLTSLDMLTEQKDLKNLINQKQFANEKVLFSDATSLIYKETPKTIKMIFLFNETDLKKADGFFDYQEKDISLIKNRQWFSITTISIN